MKTKEIVVPPGFVEGAAPRVECTHAEPHPGCLPCANSVILALRSAQVALDRHRMRVLNAAAAQRRRNMRVEKS